MSEEVIIPYNINNILITKDDIKMLFKKYNLDIEVNNIDNYILALTHKSYIVTEYTNYNNSVLKAAKESMDVSVVELMESSNERIEHFGDTVIKCIVARYLYLRYYKEDEGFLTKTKTKIENKETLANFARKLGIDNYLIISKQNEEAGNRNSDKFLEDAYEAFIGALFFDQGYEFCEKYITILLETEIDYADILYKDTNFKDKLQRFYHQNGWNHPVFNSVETKIKNKKLFTAILNDASNNPIMRATEKSIKKAEQKVSMFALLKFGQLYSDQIVENFV